MRPLPLRLPHQVVLDQHLQQRPGCLQACCRCGWLALETVPELQLEQTALTSSCAFDHHNSSSTWQWCFIKSVFSCRIIEKGVIHTAVDARRELQTCSAKSVSLRLKRYARLSCAPLSAMLRACTASNTSNTHWPTARCNRAVMLYNAAVGRAPTWRNSSRGPTHDARLWSKYLGYLQRGVGSVHGCTTEVWMHSTCMP